MPVGIYDRAMWCEVFALSVMCLMLSAALAQEEADPRAAAQRALRARRYVEAERNLLRALVADPLDAELYSELGGVYEKLKRTEQAVQAYELSLMALPPTDKRSGEQERLARTAEAKLRRLDEAGRPVREATDEYVRKMVELGTRRLADGHAWQARQAFRNAWLLAPSNAAAREGLAKARKALGEPVLAERLEEAKRSVRTRAIGKTGRSAPEDLVLIAMTPEAEGELPVAGIRVGGQVMRPEKYENGIFFVAVDPVTGKMLGSRQFLTRDAVGSGARCSLFLERQQTGTIVAGVSVGAVEKLPGVLWQGLERVGLRRAPLAAEDPIVLALIGVKGAPRGSAVWETGTQKVVVRVAETTSLKGPLDEPKLDF